MKPRTCTGCGKPLAASSRETSFCENCTRLATLRADAPKPVSDDPRIAKTGIFETQLPRGKGDLVRYFLERRDNLPFVSNVPAFAAWAGEIIEKKGFPLAPTDTDLLRASAFVFEAYQLRDAYQQLQSKLEILRSSRVSEAITAELTTRFGTSDAEKWTLQLLNAAVEVGVLSQRFDVRDREPDAMRGRKVMTGVTASHSVRYGTTEERELRRSDYVAEFNRVRKRNPHMSNSRVAQIIADKFEVSARTVLRYLPKK